MFLKSCIQNHQLFLKYFTGLEMQNWYPIYRINLCYSMALCTFWPCHLFLLIFSSLGPESILKSSYNTYVILFSTHMTKQTSGTRPVFLGIFQRALSVFQTESMERFAAYTTVYHLQQVKQRHCYCNISYNRDGNYRKILPFLRERIEKICLSTIIFACPRLDQTYRLELK